MLVIFTYTNSVVVPPNEFYGDTTAVAAIGTFGVFPNTPVVNSPNVDAVAQVGIFGVLPNTPVVSTTNYESIASIGTFGHL
jgi:hypothetical protein